MTLAGGQVSAAVDGRPLSPRPAKPLPVHHSPEFDFGSVGAGSAQLAIAILCDHFEFEAKAAEISVVLLATKAVHNDGRGEHAAMRLHQIFKKLAIAEPAKFFTRVVPEKGDRDTSRRQWTIDSSGIRDAIRACCASIPGGPIPKLGASDLRPPRTTVEKW